MHTVHGATARIGGYGGEEGGACSPEANFLPFQVAPGLHGAGVLIDIVLKLRISPRFGPIRRRDCGQKQERHGAPNGPAMARRAGHAAERVRQAGRNREDQNQLEKV